MLEVIVILGRNNQDFHITRILRPVFLLDTQLMKDVKRYIILLGQTFATYTYVTEFRKTDRIGTLS